MSVIDSNPDAFGGLGPSFNGTKVTGYGFDQAVLTEAGIERADAFAAVSSGDNSNIIAARVARETFGIQQVVARIYDPGRAEVYQRLGITTVATVNGPPTRCCGDPARRSGAELPRPLRHDPRRPGACPETWVGSDRELQDQSSSRIAWIDRLGEGMLPTRETVLQEGDMLHLVCVSRTPAVSTTYSRGPGGRLMRVAIAGAGAVGASIARELIGNGHKVLLIERSPPDQARPRPDAEWLLADSCELSSLEEARLQDCDVVIAATGDDKANLVTSLLAKTEFGVPRTVGRVNHPNNEWLFTEAWGVDVNVSTPRIMSALVEEAVTVGDLVRLFTFRKGNANLVEMTMPSDSPYVGKPSGLVPSRRTARGDDPARRAGLHARPRAADRGRRRLLFVVPPRSRRSWRRCSPPTSTAN